MRIKKIKLVNNGNGASQYDVIITDLNFWHEFRSYPETYDFANKKGYCFNVISFNDDETVKTDSIASVILCNFKNASFDRTEFEKIQKIAKTINAKAYYCLGSADVLILLYDSDENAVRRLVDNIKDLCTCIFSVTEPHINYYGHVRKKVDIEQSFDNFRKTYNKLAHSAHCAHR